MIEAIIAIISTVIGTILGWILGNVNFGKLYVSLTDEKVKAFYINPETMNIPDKKDYELYGVNINFTIMLYNSSKITKAIRDCRLSFLDNNNKEIACLPVMDAATHRRDARGSVWDSIDIVNVEASKSINLNAVLSIQNINKIYDTSEIHFTYKNERFRQKTIKFKDLNFKSLTEI